MTVPSSTRRAGPFNGNGATIDFPFTFKVFAAEDVGVYLTDAAGAQTRLSSGYTVTLNPDQDVSPGGTVRYPAAGSPMAEGNTLDLLGEVAFTQGTDLTNLGRYLPQVIENALDKLTILAQQLRERFARTIQFPVGEVPVATSLPQAAARAGKALTFDEDGGITVSENNFAALAASASSSAASSASSAAAAAQSERQAGAIVLGDFLQDGSGAVARTFASKNRDVVSVFDFMTAAQVADVRARTLLLDMTASIQKAIDFVAYERKGGTVVLPSGSYKTSDTLHLGYGVTYNGNPFTAVVLEGEAAGSSVSGTLILPTFRDRPVVAISGARGTCVRRIGFLGDRTYMVAQKLDFPAGQNEDYATHPGNAAADDTATWVNPAWPASASSRYAPFCAIAVDPYGGAAPATPYPDVAFPAFLGAVPQYSKFASSGTNFEELFIEGFVAGIVHSPSGSSTQDDFSRVKHAWIQYCVYGVSVGHTDARLMSISDSYMPNCHTCLVGDVHGQQLGQFGSAITNVGFDRSIRWFSFADVAGPYTGPVTFLNCYGENCWRIGKFGNYIGSAQAGTYPLILQNCNANFNGDSALGRPANMIEIGERARLVLAGGRYSFNSGSAFSILGNSGNAEVSATFEETDAAAIAALSPYEKYARQAGPVVFSGNQLGLPAFAARWSGFNSQTGARVARGASTAGVVCDKTAPAPFYASHLVPSGGKATTLGSAKRVQNPQAGQAFTKSSLSDLSLVGRTLTLTFAARSEAQFLLRGPLPGDVIVDERTGATFYVYNRTGLVVLARLQNNFRDDGAGGYLYAVPMDMTTASATSLVFLNSRLYTPAYYTQGTLTSASNVITAAGSDDAGLTSLATDIVVGGAIYVDPYEDAIAGTGGSDPIITAVSNGARTITLTGNVTKNETRRQLGLFVLPPVANI